jgi:hypothetical protein
MVVSYRSNGEGVWGMGGQWVIVFGDVLRCWDAQDHLPPKGFVLAFSCVCRVQCIVWVSDCAVDIVQADRLFEV